ncbi:MAG: hypothetical protein COT73_02055 [Bdellovibrio sp. CG10_big_fil_rev_8_21_14_0_10_47_8]|nr:MAG: hypothetical protein COT73_02055 [Bdellovibrio sp. CG10_big_fil_rev_8_21_14_0_10_47_8]
MATETLDDFLRTRKLGPYAASPTKESKPYDDPDDWRVQILREMTPEAEKPFNFLVGQVMKAAKGQADPKMVRFLLVDMIYGPTVNRVVEMIEKE